MAIGMKVSFQDQISKNRRDSLLLAVIVFSILVGLIYVIGLVFAPEISMVFLLFAVVFVFIYTYGTYNYGDRIVLASTGAKEIDYSDRKYVHFANVVEGLSLAAGIPKPRIYVIKNDEINAFATGKDPRRASIAVTTGALKGLKRDELEGVVAHELSHIRNYDIRFATVVAVMVGLIGIISYMFRRSFVYAGGGDRKSKGKGGLLIVVGLVLAIFAPFVVRLVQLAMSRRREYMADASAVELTRYPDGLANALEKIMEINRGKMQVSEAVSHIFFIDPTKSPIDSLFATHPPIEKRIQVLRAM